jgi:putative spermidine/putrescine transport system permease protein
MTSLERLGVWLVWTTAALCAIFLLTPLVVTIAVSFGSSAVFTLPPPGWSMRWYERLLVTRGLMESLGTSLQIAALSTAISLGLGTLCAIGLARGRFPGRDAISTFLVSPLMLPGLVIGIAMLQGFKSMGLRAVWPSLLVAHVVITMPYVLSANARLLLPPRTVARACAGAGARVPHLRHVRVSGLDG